MSKTLDSWGTHLNEHALLLLQKAEDVAQTQGASLNILHILFIILTNTALTTHRTITQIIEQKTLVDLASDIQQKMEENALYLDLDMYRMACIEVAQQQRVQISDALILAQILEKSYTIEQMLLSHNIALHELKRSVEDLLHTAKKLTDTSSFYLPSATSALHNEEIETLMQEVKRKFQIFEDSALEKTDHRMHSTTFDMLLAALEKIIREGRGQIIVFCGQNGSVINVLEPVLAYRLGLIRRSASEASTLSVPDALRGYTLWQISVNTLLSLYSCNRRLHPAVALRYLKQEAVKAKAILLLTGLETLSRRSAIGRKIREQLRRPDGACIVGCYRYYERQPDEDEVRLGLDNVRLQSPEHLEDNRLAFNDLIRNYHLPRWEEHGYTLDKNTFESLFTLEPGIWIDKQRKTFPYLAIGLGDDCVNTLQDGEQHIRGMAADAGFALGKLLTEEAPQVDEKRLMKFRQTLEEAMERVNTLYEHPQMQIRDGKIVITRALLEVQLFCRNNSEVHFPGFFPWAVPAKYQQEDVSGSS